VAFGNKAVGVEYKLNSLQIKKALVKHVRASVLARQFQTSSVPSQEG